MKKSNITAVAISLALMTGAINIVSAKSIQMGGTALTCSSNADCKKKCEDKGHTWKPNPGGSTFGTCTKKRGVSLQRFQKPNLSRAPLVGQYTPQGKKQKPILLKPQAPVIGHLKAKPKASTASQKVKLMGAKQRSNILKTNPNKMKSRGVTLSKAKVTVMGSPVLKKPSIKSRSTQFVKPIPRRQAVLIKKPTLVLGANPLKVTGRVKLKAKPARAVVSSGFAPAVQSYSPNISGSNVLNELDMRGYIDKEVSVPLQLLADELQTAFQGTQIHLNNYGSRHDNSWYRGNDSYVEFPAMLNTPRKQFSFPAFNRAPFRYYINDVNLSSVQVNEEQGAIAIDFNFESNGMEVKGRCAPWCPLGTDSSAPDIQMNNAKASVKLTPVLRNGSVSFSQVNVDFTASLQAQGSCDVAGISSLCNYITDYKSQIKNGVKNALKSAIDSNTIRDDIALRLRIKLAQQNIRNIQSVEVHGRILVIKYRQMLNQMKRAE